MRVVRIAEPGSPDALQVADRPVPEPGPDEVRVRVAAAGVNRADLLQRAGRYPAPRGCPADVPGLEVAGEVDAIGDSVGGWTPGNRVMGLIGGGGYAEQVTIHERQLLSVPDGLDIRTAAAVPEAYVTAHDALFARGGLTAGETVLIHAVGGGVGLATLHLAKAAGARVLGTSRTPEKLDAAGTHGLDVAIRTPPSDADGDDAPPGFGEAVREGTGGRGCDVVIDLVGGRYVAEDLEAVSERGRIVVVGLLAGARVDLDLATLLRRRLTVVGTVLRSRPLEEKAAAVQRAGVQLRPLLASGELRPVVDRVLPMERAAEAHRLMASNAPFGKIVLSWSE